jgi:hypothetical protein
MFDRLAGREIGRQEEEQGRRWCGHLEGEDAGGGQQNGYGVFFTAVCVCSGFCPRKSSCMLGVLSFPLSHTGMRAGMMGGIAFVFRSSHSPPPLSPPLLDLFSRLLYFVSLRLDIMRRWACG